MFRLETKVDRVSFRAAPGLIQLYTFMDILHKMNPHGEKKILKCVFSNNIHGLIAPVANVGFFFLFLPNLVLDKIYFWSFKFKYKNAKCFLLGLV